MFDIGWSEMAVIAMIALIVIGPRDLPKVLRTVGQWAGKARRMAREFQNSVDDMVRESELDEVRKTVTSATSYDVGKEIENTIDPGGELARELDPTAPTAPPGAASDEPAEGGDAPGEPRPAATESAGRAAGEESAPAGAADDRREIAG